VANAIKLSRCRCGFDCVGLSLSLSLSLSLCHTRANNSERINHAHKEGENTTTWKRAHEQHTTAIELRATPVVG
jgi:homoserine kinase